jgi:hypothetical protein
MAGPSCPGGAIYAWAAQAGTPFPSESAAVQAWIDGQDIRCRYCPEQIDRAQGRWFHVPGWLRLCPNRTTHAAPKVAG